MGKQPRVKEPDKKVRIGWQLVMVIIPIPFMFLFSLLNEQVLAIPLFMLLLLPCWAFTKINKLIYFLIFIISTIAICYGFGMLLGKNNLWILGGYGIIIVLFGQIYLIYTWSKQYNKKIDLKVNDNSTPETEHKEDQ